MGPAPSSAYGLVLLGLAVPAAAFSSMCADELAAEDGQRHRRERGRCGGQNREEAQAELRCVQQPEQAAARGPAAAAAAGVWQKLWVVMVFHQVLAVLLLVDGRRGRRQHRLAGIVDGRHRREHRLAGGRHQTS